MSHAPIPPTPRQIRSAAEAIANARGLRRGMPVISNIWDLLPPNLQSECLEDAEAALNAAAAEESDEAPSGQGFPTTWELLDALRAARNAEVLAAAAQRARAAVNEAAEDLRPEAEMNAASTQRWAESAAEHAAARRKDVLGRTNLPEDEEG